MKVLISGYHNPYFITITEYIERAIRSLGHEVYVFDDRQHIMPGRIRKRIQFLNELDLHYINRQFKSIALEKKPDVVIVTGGHRILPETVVSLKRRGVRTMLWTIDPPRDFQPIIKVAPHYDHIFCQGTEAIELLEGNEIIGARWIPMACDPDLHHPVTLTDEERRKLDHDVVFMGSHYPDRADLFSKLIRFDLAIWGPGWDKLNADSPLKPCIKGTHTTPDQWLKIYSASKIVLATHYQDPEGSFPVYQASPRIFEALACGSFVISDAQRDVLALFKDGTHLVTFENSDALVDMVKYYIDHPDERSLIARKGREEVLKNHTYVKRIENLFLLARDT